MDITPLRKYWETRTPEPLDNNPPDLEASLLKPSINTRRSKRKSTTASPVLSKKMKLDDESTKVVADIVAAAIEKSTVTITAALTDTLKSNHAEVLSTIEPLRLDVAKLNTQYDTLNSAMEEQAGRINSLSLEINTVKDSVKEELAKEAEQAVSKTNLEAFHFNLGVANDKANCNIIIHGLAGSNSQEEGNSLVASMSIPPSSNINIMSVTKLGKGKEGKPPSVLVTLQNHFQRNDLLKHSKNLPTGITLDKDIPLVYREAYKRMRKDAWQCRLHFNVTTQVVLVNHTLQLRYQDKGGEGKKAFTIVDQFIPTPEHQNKFAKGNISQPGAASSSISKDAFKAAQEKVLLIGIGSRSSMEIDAMLKAVLKKAEYNAIKDIVIAKGNALISISDKAMLSRVVKDYNGKEHDGFKFKLEQFTIQSLLGI